MAYINGNNILFSAKVTGKKAIIHCNALPTTEIDTTSFYELNGKFYWNDGEWHTLGEGEGGGSIPDDVPFMAMDDLHVREEILVGENDEVCINAQRISAPKVIADTIDTGDFTVEATLCVGANEEVFIDSSGISAPKITVNGKNVLVEGEGGSGGIVDITIPVTYAELKALRDSNSLIAGCFYRITDYECTTAQENTRAMNHPFDIIVQALSTNTLSETASADYHEGDEYFGAFIENKLLKLDAVTVHYSVYEDYLDKNGSEEGLYPGNGNDKLVAYDYLANNDGDTVPVLYKTDINNFADEPDYEDVYYYVGTETIDNITYDKWRLINEDSDQGPHWDGSTGYKHILTDCIVENNEIIDSVKDSETKIRRCNLPAWELKYCLDNDTTRFAWASDSDVTMMRTDDGCWFTNTGTYEYEGITYYKWETDFPAWLEEGNHCLLTATLTPKYGEFSDMAHHITFADDGSVDNFEEEYSTTLDLKVSGKGVIYYMKDEFNNECPYDFKNIQFIRNDTFCYTFGGGQCDRSINHNRLQPYNNNSIGAYRDDVFILPGNVFLGASEGVTNNNKINNDCYDNTFGDACKNNILHYCSGITFGDNTNELWLSNNAAVGTDEIIRTTGSSSDYLATVPSITELKAGVSFIMVPHTNKSYGSVTLNVNGLGAKNIVRYVSNGSMTTSIDAATFINRYKAYRVIYNGTYWILEDFAKPIATDLYGVVPVANGGVPETSVDNAGKVLTTNSGGTPEWKTPNGVGWKDKSGKGEKFNYEGNRAEGNYSHAEGRSNATGDYSHSEGSSTTASGDSSHAEGCLAEASGMYSHAEGVDTTASGYASHAEGSFTIARGGSQHVQGKYNVEDFFSKYSHIVGNGADEENRSNAHTVDWGGNAWFAGDVYVGGTGQDDENAEKLVKQSELEVAVANTSGAKLYRHTYLVNITIDSDIGIEGMRVSFYSSSNTQLTGTALLDATINGNVRGMPYSNQSDQYFIMPDIKANSSQNGLIVPIIWDDFSMSEYTIALQSYESSIYNYTITEI